MASNDSYVTLYTEDDAAAATLTRPRLYGDLNAGRWTLSAIDGVEIATFTGNPTFAALRRALRNAEAATRVARLEALRENMAAMLSPATLSPEEAATVRAVAMRASVPAVEAAASALSRRLETMAPRDAMRARARLRIAGQVVALKTSAVPGRVVSAFALPLRASVGAV
jgi:hypothetical protein